MTIDRRCGTCAHWIDRAYSVRSASPEVSYGKCAHPLTVAPLPACFHSPPTCVMREMDGGYCPTWIVAAEVKP